MHRWIATFPTAFYAAVALAFLLLAPIAAFAKPPPEGPPVRPGRGFYKATICANGKVYGGGPKRTAACHRGFTTVAGHVSYDGAHAKASGPVTCRADSNGPRNDYSWCGVVNNGAGPPDFFMSLGANGELETVKQKSRDSSTSIDVKPEGIGAGASESRGSSREIVKKRSYWIRIDVRPDGTYNLRGGLNK